MHLIVGVTAPGRVGIRSWDGVHEAEPFADLPREELAAFVAEREAEARPRWVWSDAQRWYLPLLAAGVRVARAWDLRLVHAILAAREAVAPHPLWAGDAIGEADPAALFELSDDRVTAAHLEESLREFGRQRRELAADPSGGLTLLAAAESVGALIAAEIRWTGMPWRADVHESMLREALGPRPAAGSRPQRMEALIAAIRAALSDPALNPDSPHELQRSLSRAGILVSSTRAWELREIDHPVRDPLLEYKKLSRLYSANGWAWLETWVHDGRLRPEYVPGGVPTGRWATRGGGALQLPKQIRGAVHADPGWKLVVADAAQLEPRVLAAMSADHAMAAAGRGADLYAGIVAAGAVDTRAHAKVAMLGALYGATTGESARLLPRLNRAFPRATALVEAAARAGESGAQVHSLLGRASPLPPAEWFAVQQRASEPDATAADEARARSRARDWGRFTRNFVVQSTAAEWALCWLGDLRARLAGVAAADAGPAGAPAPFERSPHLVYFLHDEVIVHTPAERADEVAAAVADAAAGAGRTLFGTAPVEFPLEVAVVDDYGQA